MAAQGTPFSSSLTASYAQARSTRTGSRVQSLEAFGHAFQPREELLDETRTLTSYWRPTARVQRALTYDLEGTCTADGSGLTAPEADLRSGWPAVGHESGMTR